MKCSRCGGIWLLAATVEKLSQSGLLEAIDSTDVNRRKEDRQTGLCPEGHGIMTRARVTWKDPYYLERCSRCGGIWFDAGEWNRLAAENLLDHLEDLWEPRWRQGLSRAEADAGLRARLTAAFGDELLAKLDELADALATREDSGVALAYLRERILRGARTD